MQARRMTKDPGGLMAMCQSAEYKLFSVPPPPSQGQKRHRVVTLGGQLIDASGEPIR